MFFRDVIGHRDASVRLRRALAGERPPHAILLAGPRGVGKRLLADAAAAGWLCPDAEEGEACGTCRACRLIASGFHPDLHLVERSEGRRDVGIAQVRETTERVHRRTERGRRAVIVDEAERLTVEAQNALLKTLEEPPPGTLFLLVTSRLTALLPTVRSRSAIVRVSPLRSEDLRRFAASRGLDEGEVPVEAAGGRPGRLLELAKPEVRRLRKLAFRWLAADGSDPLLPYEVLSACQAAEGESDRSSHEAARSRLLLFLEFLEEAAADAQALVVGAPKWVLRHPDLAQPLPADRGPDLLLDFRDRVSRAAAEVRRNVDPGLLLRELLAFLASAA